MSTFPSPLVLRAICSCTFLTASLRLQRQHAVRTLRDHPFPTGPTRTLPPQLNEAVVLFICSMAVMLANQQVTRVFRLAGSKQVRTGWVLLIGSRLRHGWHLGPAAVAQEAGRGSSTGHVAGGTPRSCSFNHVA